MSNDLIELAKDCGASSRLTKLVTGEIVEIIKFTVEELVEFTSLIEAKQSARIAELEAQLARYEAVGAIVEEMRGEDGALLHFAKLFKHLPISTKLFALKDEK
jgi:hypothetical protein